MRYLLLSVLVVCVIGVMIIPNTFAQVYTNPDLYENYKDAIDVYFHDRTSPAVLMWTDKDSYEKGDTVTFSGIYNRHYLNESAMNDSTATFDCLLHDGNFNPVSEYLNRQELDVIVNPEARTFSSSITLSGQDYPTDEEIESAGTDLMGCFYRLEYQREDWSGASSNSIRFLSNPPESEIITSFAT